MTKRRLGLGVRTEIKGICPSGIMSGQVWVVCTIITLEVKRSLENGSNEYIVQYR